MRILPAPTYPIGAGESPGELIARIVRVYAGCSCKVRRDELAALVGRGVQDESIVTWRTNCALFALGVLAAAGVRHTLLAEPTRIEMAFCDLVRIGDDLGAWRDPATAGAIPVGAWMWYRLPGLNDDHIECFLSNLGPEHGGAGRADNAVTIATGIPALSCGRPMYRWLDPEDLGIATLDVEPHHDTPEPHE